MLFGRTLARLKGFGVTNAGELAGSSFSPLGAVHLRVQPPGQRASVSASYLTACLRSGTYLDQGCSS
jgi:hypothetical protein